MARLVKCNAKLPNTLILNSSPGAHDVCLQQRGQKRICTSGVVLLFEAFPLSKGHKT